MKRWLDSQPAWILAGTLLGALIGWLRPAWTGALLPLETLFLRLIMLVVGPLIFALLTNGLARHSGRRLGRIAWKALLLFEAFSTLALFWGWMVARALPVKTVAALPGVRPPAAAARQFARQHASAAGSVLFALAHDRLLQIVLVSLLIGAAMNCLGGRARPLLKFCAILERIMLRLTRCVMWTAPPAVMAAVAWSVAHPGVLAGVTRFVFETYAALAVFSLAAFGGAIWLTRLPAQPFWRAVREPVLIGFATASSEAALPAALENLERMGVPDEIAALVMPAGYSFNLTGTSVYLPAAMLFLAAAGGIALPWTRQLAMLLTLMLASKGLAGVPRAVFIVLTGLAASLGLPPAGIALLLAVDPFIDMARTAVNVMGNCLTSALVAQWEKVLMVKAGAQAGGN